MEPPSLSEELNLSLKELSFGVQSHHVLSAGPIAGSSGAPPMARIEMIDETELVVQVTERGWQICDPLTQSPNPTRHETLDDLLTANNTAYKQLRQGQLMQKLLAVAAERESVDSPGETKDE